MGAKGCESLQCLASTREGMLTRNVCESALRFGVADGREPRDQVRQELLPPGEPGSETWPAAPYTGSPSRLFVVDFEV